MDKLPKDRSATERERSPGERGFRSPPLWIHVSQAGRWLISRREARRRAVIRLLDRVSGAKKPVI
jgi:hypothetical protein